MQIYGKTEKSKGRFSNNGSKLIVSDCQQEQEAQGITEKKGWKNDGEDGHGQRGACRGKKPSLVGLTAQDGVGRSLLSNIRF